MTKTEYTDKMVDIEKRFFLKYSEYYSDDLYWLSQNIWPNVKYTLQCHMGVINEENIDHDKYTMGFIQYTDLVNEYGEA